MGGTAGVPFVDNTPQGDQGPTQFDQPVPDQGPTQFDAPQPDAGGGGAAPPAATQPTPEQAATQQTQPQGSNPTDQQIRGASTVHAPQPGGPTPPPPKRSGLAGIIDEFRNALDPTDHSWKNVASEALHGGAAGWAAGRGAGHGGDALMAGVQAGDQQQQKEQQAHKDQAAAAQKAKLDQFNQTMLKQKILQNQFDLTHLKQQATQADINFENERVAEEEKLQSAFLGQFSGLDTLPEVEKAHPEIIKDFYNKNDVQVIPHIDPQTGLHDGVSVYLRRPGMSGALLPPGQPVATAAMDENGTYQLGKGITSAPMRQEEIDAASNAAHVKVGTQQNMLAQQAYQTKKQQEADAQAQARLEETKAQTAKTIAEINKMKTPAADDPQVANLGEAVARGALTVDEISKFGKGTQAAVENYLTQHHPNLDQNSVFLDGGQRKQVNLANNALENLTAIQDTIQRRPDLIGQINGRWSQGKEITGTDDPDLARVATALDAYSLATTGAHGVKAVQARENAITSLLNNFKNGPNAVQASIATMRNSLTNLARAGKPKGVDGTPYVYKTQPQGTPPAAAAPAGGGTQPPAPAAGATSMVGPVQPGEHVSVGPKGTVVFRGNQWVDPMTGKVPPQ